MPPVKVHENNFQQKYLQPLLNQLGCLENTLGDLQKRAYINHEFNEGTIKEIGYFESKLTALKKRVLWAGPEDVSCLRNQISNVREHFSAFTSTIGNVAIENNGDEDKPSSLQQAIRQQISYLQTNLDALQTSVMSKGKLDIAMVSQISNLQAQITSLKIRLIGGDSVSITDIQNTINTLHGKITTLYNKFGK